jgi:16S rRNA (guanine966-N2)-methyltransferase
MTRIISGKAKGKKLFNLMGDLVQPTAGRTKEALFSILDSRQFDGAFLDLFAGSGQIGLEAASRGFSPVILVEKSRSAQQVIRKNIAATKLQTDATLICLAARQAITMLHKQGLCFNVIFLDPPWKLAAELFSDLAVPLTELLHENGILILEHHKNVKSPEAVTGLEYSSSCKYGNAVLSFYQKVAQ